MCLQRAAQRNISIYLHSPRAHTWLASLMAHSLSLAPLSNFANLSKACVLAAGVDEGSKLTQGVRTPGKQLEQNPSPAIKAKCTYNQKTLNSGTLPQFIHVAATLEHACMKS